MANVTVSVIIPNYNHALYLAQRIESVLNQTYQDFEVIILDDCSTDNSQPIIRQYAAQDKRIRTVFNTTNSGSPFAQWNKGVRLAQGGYVWIAESDDYAETQFLEKLVPILMAHPNIGLIYSQSYNVDENSKILSSRLDWTADLDRKRWGKFFINSGINELSHYFLFKNTIPNASAVLMRKSTFLEVGGAHETMRLNGDKMTWTKMLLAADIGYWPEHLNFFRTHTQNVRSRTSYKNKLENFEWASFLTQNISIPYTHRDRFINVLLKEWKQTLFNKEYPEFLEAYQSFFSYGRKISYRLHYLMWIYFVMGLPLIGVKYIYYRLADLQEKI